MFDIFLCIWYTIFMKKDMFTINKNGLSYGRGYVYSLQYHLVWCTKYRKKVLKNSLDKIKKDYDYMFIDCPPSLGLLTINSLAAVDSVLIPIQCEFYALEGVSQLVSTIDLVKKSLNPHLEVQGVILSMFDGRTNLSAQVVQEVKRYFGGKVYSTVIPRNVRLAEAPSYGLPITEYDPKSKGAEAYMEFAEEFLELEEE